MKKLLFLLLVLVLGLFVSNVSFATCSNYTTYSDGQVLTAGSLNSLQTNYTNCFNDILDGTTFTGDLNLHSNSDVNLYTDTGTTKTIALDGATGGILGATYTTGQTFNCGMEISGSTFTIEGFNGSALSATNPCYVSVKSDSTGSGGIVKFIADVDVTFGSTSNTDGNLFGIDDSDWSSAMPFFIGVIYNGTNGYFTLSRKPFQGSGATSATLCQLDDTDCDDETDVMILTTGLTLSAWVNLPITQFGWIQGTYATSGGAWTFSLNKDSGFNKTYNVVRFTMASSQMQAASGRYLRNNGGTPPAFSTSDYTYSIDENCNSTSYVYLSGDGGTDGSGAVTSLIVLPYKSINVTNAIVAGVGLVSSPTENYIGFASIVANENSFSITRQADSGGAIQSTTSVTDHALFTNGGRDIQFTVNYKTSCL